MKPGLSGRANGGRATLVTIATADRAAQSRIFARSARECYPDARLTVLVPDCDAPPRTFEDLYDLVIPAEQLSLGGLADMRFRYSTAELCFALKPWLIRHVFEKLPDEPIYYFDADIELFTPLAEAEAALAHGDQASGRLAYLQWLVEFGFAELEIPAAFVPPARSALDRERVRQLEAGDEAAMPPPGIADPGLSPPPSVETIAGLIAARDAERDRIHRRDNDIGLLVGSNKALRRELHGLRVRRWRDEETIQAFETELAQTQRARDGAIRRSRRLADEVAILRAWPWHPFAGWVAARPPQNRTKVVRRPILAGDRPFFQRGFVLSDAAVIDGTTVRRIKSAPSGTLVYGPYVNFAAGTYALTVDARLYQRLPLLSIFQLDVVCDDARQLVGLRKFPLYSIARWQRFELVFTVWGGEDYPDFEVRIWARKGTPLEIGRMDLYQLIEEPQTASVMAPHPNGDAASP